MTERLSWDDYFMSIARMVSGRSTCPRKSVGAVIVRDHTILSTGYNGSIRGLGHCDQENSIARSSLRGAQADCSAHVAGRLEPLPSADG